jgi:hypothetical protein
MPPVYPLNQPVGSSANSPKRLTGTKAMQNLITLMNRGDTVRIAMPGDSTTLGVGTSEVDNDLVSEPRAIPVVVANPAYPQYTQTPVGWPTYTGHTAHPYLKTMPAYLEATLQAKYGANVTVKNCGYAGQSIANGWANEFLKSAVLDVYNQDGNLKAIIFGFGLNDMLPNTNQADNYGNEAEKLITRCLDLGILPIFLGSDRIVRNQGSANAGTGLDYDGSYYAHELKGRLQEICQAYQVPFIDMEAELDTWFTTNEDNVSFSRAQNGGVHFNGIGYAYKAGLIARRLIPNIITHSGGVTRLDCKHPATNYVQPYLTSALGNNFLLPDTATVTGVTEAELTWDTTMSEHVTFTNIPTSQTVAGQYMTDLWLWNERPSTLFLKNHGTTVASTFVPTADTYPNLHVFANHNYTTPINTRQRVGQSGYTSRLREALDRPQQIVTLPMGLIRIRLLPPVTASTFFYQPNLEINSLYPRLTRRLQAGGAIARRDITTNAIPDTSNAEQYYTNGTLTTGAVWFEEREDLRNMVDCSITGDEVILDIETMPNWPIGCAIPLTVGRFKQNNATLAPNQNGYGACLLRKNATEVELVEFGTGGLSELSTLIAVLPNMSTNGVMACRVRIERIAPDGLSRQQRISVCAPNSNTPLTLSAVAGWVANTVYPAGAFIHQNAPGTSTLTKYYTTAGLTSGATWDATEAARWTSKGTPPTQLQFVTLMSSNNRFMPFCGYAGGLAIPTPVANQVYTAGYKQLNITHKNR